MSPTLVSIRLDSLSPEIRNLISLSWPAQITNRQATSICASSQPSGICKYFSRQSISVGLSTHMYVCMKQCNKVNSESSSCKHRQLIFRWIPDLAPHTKHNVAHSGYTGRSAQWVSSTQNPLFSGMIKEHYLHTISTYFV